MCRRFGILWSIFIGGVNTAYKDGTKERMYHSEDGESLKREIKMWRKVNWQSAAALFFFTSSQSRLSAHLNTDMSITVTITPVRSATCCGD
jgi:hypothetical protein